jgi:hypothetical protein
VFGAGELDWYAIVTKAQGIHGSSVRHYPRTN